MKVRALTSGFKCAVTSVVNCGGTNMTSVNAPFATFSVYETGTNGVVLHAVAGGDAVRQRIVARAEK
jgi:hypothetical protein